MKRFLQLISCVALMAVANTSFAQTADAKADRPSEMTAKYSKALKLTPDQTGSIKSLAVNYYAELDVLAADKATFEAKKIELDNAYEVKVKAILNAEQITQYDELKAKQKAKAERK
jgi:hypothetical protein